MIKGVTKSILEINASKSDYFEKAILILREDCCDISERELRIRAELMIGGEPPKFIYRRKAEGVIRLAAAAALGALLSAAVFYIAAVFV